MITSHLCTEAIFSKLEDYVNELSISVLENKKEERDNASNKIRALIKEILPSPSKINLNNSEKYNVHLNSTQNWWKNYQINQKSTRVLILKELSSLDAILAWKFSKTLEPTSSSTEILINIFSNLVKQHHYEKALKVFFTLPKEHFHVSSIYLSQEIDFNLKIESTKNKMLLNLLKEIDNNNGDNRRELIDLFLKCINNLINENKNNFRYYPRESLDSCYYLLFKNLNKCEISKFHENADYIEFMLSVVECLDDCFLSKTYEEQKNKFNILKFDKSLATFIQLKENLHATNDIEMKDSMIYSYFLSLHWMHESFTLLLQIVNQITDNDLKRTAKYNISLHKFFLAICTLVERDASDLITEAKERISAQKGNEKNILIDLIAKLFKRMGLEHSKTTVDLWLQDEGGFSIIDNLLKYEYSEKAPIKKKSEIPSKKMDSSKNLLLEMASEEKFDYTKMSISEDTLKIILLIEDEMKKAKLISLFLEELENRSSIDGIEEMDVHQMLEDSHFAERYYELIG